MNYRRVLLLAQLQDPAAAAAASHLLRRLVPAAERLVVVAALPVREFAWFSSSAPPDLDRAATAAQERLRAAVHDAAPEVDLVLVPELDFDAIDGIATAADIDLLALATMSFDHATLVARLRERRRLPVLWLPASAPAVSERPPGDWVCIAIGQHARAAVAAFLRDHGDASRHVTVLLLAGPVPPDLASAVALAGIRASVDFVAPQGLSSQQWLDGCMRRRPPDLVVYARMPTALLLGARWPAPSLLLAPRAPVQRPLLLREIDAPDLLDDGGALRALFEHAAGWGRRTPIPDQRLAFVAGGRVVAEVDSHDGQAELPAEVHHALAADDYGVFRTHGQPSTHPLAKLEQRVHVIRPGGAAWLLFDAELADETLDTLRRLGQDGAHEMLAVRLRPIRSCRTIREGLRAAGLASRVVDARAVLDEGTALDVPDAVDAVRLARVAARLRVAGFAVVAIVHQGDPAPTTDGYLALHARDLDTGMALPAQPARSTAQAPADRLRVTTGAASLSGHLIELEIDNTLARRWLLDAIDGAAQRIHLQVYMASDDALARRVEAALARAAARGVQLRVLVDSLHGLHGSLGAHNPLLERLGALPGVELRVSQPITELPSLHELKQRDHRKLVLIDNRLALLGGRNLAHEYYTGFDEVALHPGSSWREVPWLDAGARLLGPAVARLEHGFRDAWRAAGGAGFEIAECAPAGTTSARVIVHHGLRDAATLEAYLALIDTARSRLLVVNGFPLILEIQHALLRALRRGVSVRTLFGQLAPSHAGQPFEGAWTSARAAATALVHSRVDALVAAGAACHPFGVAPRAAWAPGLGTVLSHVHAKVMCADGRVCAVGSANMDITGGYWETELLLLVEDAALTRGFEARIEALLAESPQVDRDDAKWQALARSRQWLRHWPGVLSI